MASISSALASISAPATGSAATPGAPDPNTNMVSEQTFLKLLVTQIKNQDPMNPADSTQFVTQLAQFSELEQMINVNTNLQTLQQDVKSGQNGSGSTPGTTATTP